jgi:hypothetical protein
MHRCVIRKKTLLLAVIAWLGSAMGARAELLEVALPALLGLYPVSPGEFARTATIVLPKLPQVIHGCSLRIAATGTIGVANCGGVGQLDSWPMEYVAEMQGNEWIAFHEPYFSAGSFESTATFESFAGGSTWDLLLDGQADVTMNGAPWSALGSCDPIVRPTGKILEAYFVIDAEFGLPVESTTWGKIKALYR